MQRSRIQVVPAGVDGAAIRAAVPLPTEGRLVLTVGRLRRARRVDRLISAMASLGSEYRLAIIGEGPERRRLEAYAADLQVSHRVRFLGSLPDAELHRWLRTARVVVALSEDHGSISQVSEGLVAGAAVVASDLPIHREAGECGPGRVWFVRPTGSPLAVADAIVEAARAELATSSGISAAPTWESMVDRIWTLYSRLLGPTPIARLVNAAHTTSTAATGLPSDSAGHGFTAQVTRS